VTLKGFRERRTQAHDMNLAAALGVLNDRERRVFIARFVADPPSTLQELADEFGVSRQRVRNIEVRAFKKVQAATTRGGTR
jgi:RNA polymerase sigma-32 factor